MELRATIVHFIRTGAVPSSSDKGNQASSFYTRPLFYPSLEIHRRHNGNVGTVIGNHSIYSLKLEICKPKHFRFKCARHDWIRKSCSHYINYW